MADIDDELFENDDIDNDNGNGVGDDDDDADADANAVALTNTRRKISVKKELDDPDYDDEEDEEEEDEDEDEDDFDIENDENDEKIFGDMVNKTSNLDREGKLGIKQNFPQFSDDDDDDDNDGEDGDDDKYLQKFEQEISKNIIADWHPELKNCNYDEIDILSRVVRDNTGNIIDPLHRTLPFITRYEKARILGERAKQINSGAKPLVNVDESLIDGYLIALKEFEEKKIPFIIKRPLPNGGCEYWKCKDLEVI